MPTGSTITAVTARQIFSDRGHPGVECTVTTQNGAKGSAVVTAGVSVGVHEVQFAYDGGTMWKGRGVLKAVDNVINVIGPKLIGMDASQQQVVDDVIIRLDGTPTKERLGGNATGSVSAAVLQAGAASLGIPLYQHIGGVNAVVCPYPASSASPAAAATDRATRVRAIRSSAMASTAFPTQPMPPGRRTRNLPPDAQKLGVDSHQYFVLVQPGVVKHDRELWDVMVEAIDNAGYTGGLACGCGSGNLLRQDERSLCGHLFCRREDAARFIRLYRIWSKLSFCHPRRPGGRR